MGQAKELPRKQNCSRTKVPNKDTFKLLQIFSYTVPSKPGFNKSKDLWQLKSPDLNGPNFYYGLL